MGTYLTFRANDADEVNREWGYDEGDPESRPWLVYSDSIVAEDSDDPSQKRMTGRGLTAKNWYRWFPFAAPGPGVNQVKLSGGELSEHEREMVTFVVENQHLFSAIDGLDDVERLTGIKVPKAPVDEDQEPEPKRGYWSLNINFDGDLSECSLEHIAHLIKEGFTEGEILQ